MNCKRNLLQIFLIVCGFFASQLFAQDPLSGDVAQGQKLFEANCTSCHALDKKVVGPALQGVYSRLNADEGLGLDWFNSWIKDNITFRESGDAYANKIYNEYDGALMNTFPNLTDDDIVNILSYLENPPPPVVEDTAAPVVVNEPTGPSSADYIWIGFLVLAGLLIYLLFQLNRLVKLSLEPELMPSEEQKIRSFKDFYTNYQGAFIALNGLIALLALWGVWSWLMGIGVDKGYQPEQPIYFSHKIHAGVNNIECQVCHSGAKYGKVSEIPSANVCMNCHQGIREYNGKYFEPGKDKAFYDGEIEKLYAHVGFDKANGKYDPNAKKEPIKWTRIHNMPDFVYFNHSQHVVVGEKTIIADYNARNPKRPIDKVCKACHGQIDTMNVVQMANDFTMEFCIECHRQTEVDMGNGYNAAYFKNLHDKLKEMHKDEEGSRITVDAVGGIECGKCHY